MRKKSINLFIVNLAVSDLLLALFVIPRLITETVLYQGIWLVHGVPGNVLCKVVVFVQDVATAVSLQSLVIIAFDRFCAVVYPLRIATRSCTTRLVVIPMTWIVAGALYSPYFFVYRLIYLDNQTASCVQLWSKDKNEHETISRRYYLTMFSLFVITPVLLLSVLYASIFFHLRKRGRKTDLQTSAEYNDRRRQQECNVLKMAIAIVLGFTACYGPFNVLIFLRIFSWNIWIPVCAFKTIYFVAVFLFFFNTALNPIIYFAFSENFRIGFMRVFTHHTKSSSSAKIFLTSVKKMRADRGESTNIHVTKTTACHVLDTAL